MTITPSILAQLQIPLPILVGFFPSTGTAFLTCKGLSQPKGEVYQQKVHTKEYCGQRWHSIRASPQNSDILTQSLSIALVYK